MYRKIEKQYAFTRNSTYYIGTRIGVLCSRQLNFSHDENRKEGSRLIKVWLIGIDLFQDMW